MSNISEKLSDSVLVQRFQEGDESAFDGLVERHAAKAYQIAYGVLGDKQDAEEVAQDVFVRVYRALGRFRGDSEFSTWMYRIAMNLARNKYRWNKSRGAQRHLSIDAPIEGRNGSELRLELPAEKPAPDEEVSLAEFKADISTQLETLPPLYREVLVLRNVKDMSYERIADLLGCKLGTIKSRIARAREELRRRLTE